MINFDIVANILLEIHCWKGYRKVGTKMKGGKRVNNCVPVKENENNNRYSITVSVLPELRHLLGQSISIDSFPGKNPEAVINKFVAKKIRDVRGPEDKIGLAIWYAKKYNPVVKIAPAVSTFNPATRWDLNYEGSQKK